MKTFRAILFIMLIIFTIQKDDFSIDIMIKYLYSSGYYYLILDIKIYFGIDPAINCCKRYINQYQSGCSEAVNYYIIRQSGVGASSSIVGGTIYDLSLDQIKKEFTNILNQINASQNFKTQIKKMFNEAVKVGKVIIINNLKVFDILRKTKSETYILNYIQKRIK